MYFLLLNNYFHFLAWRSRHSSVSIVFKLDDLGLVPGRGNDSILFSSPCADQFWGPPSFLSGGYQEGLTQVVKGQGREVDHSPPSRVEFKLHRNILPLPHTCSWRGV
jgi:hypothetical protein